MPSKTILYLCPFLLLFTSHLGIGQVRNNSQAPSERHSDSNPLWVTATAGKEQVRFASIGIVGRMRLEILNQVGDRVYDSDFQDGSLLDWKLEDQQGSRLADGLYGCLITVEDLSGERSRRRGILWLRQGEAQIEAMPGTGVNTLAAAEESDSVVLLRADVVPPVTLLTHDGKEGRMVSGKGAMSFRLGNYFSGEDVEFMRLTSDGRLGIGVSEPAAKLDVGGFIHTSEGIMFPDGTIQRSAANNDLVPAGHMGSSRDQSGGRDGVGSNSRSSQSGGATRIGGLTLAMNGLPGPNFLISGTTGRIAKFTGASDLGDSALVESGGNIGFGTLSPSYRVQIYDVGPYPRIYVQGDTGKYPGFQMGFDSIGSRVALMRTVEQDTNGTALQFYTRSDASVVTQRMIVDDAGNVGIGTPTPTARLTVAGNVNVVGAGNGIIFSDGSVLTSGSAARIRAITYLAGCDTCSPLSDADDQRTIFVNLIGAMTINSVTCFSDAGSPTVNVQRDNGVAANILTSDLTCSATGATSTAINPEQGTLNLNDQIHFVMVSAGGVAKRVTVIIKSTVN